MIDQEKDVMVAVFGKGDISVSLKEYPTTNYPVLKLQNCTKTKIGNKPEESLDSSPVIKMVFMNKESLDVVIDRLTEARDSFGK